jgi:general secretion pathway protein M
VKNYWLNLNDRERGMLGGAVIFLFLYLFYAVIYAPLTTSVAEKTQQVFEKQATLTWMQNVRHQAHAQKPKTLSSSQLLSMFAAQLKSAAFHPFSYQIQQTGAGDIQLSFEQVPYNLFLEWLWSIQQKYAFTIKQLTIEHTETPGVVKLLIVISTIQ